MLYFEKSLIRKIWQGFHAVIFLKLIAIFLYQLIYNYSSRILGLIIMLCGFALLFISKYSLFKKGIYSSFGTELMSQKMGFLYVLAYLLLILGMLMVLLDHRLGFKFN